MSSECPSGVVVVTGGARGQGLSHAVAFAAAGARVCVWDTPRYNRPTLQYRLASVQDLHGAREQLRSLEPNSDVWDVDVANREEVIRATERLINEFGRVDTLINNAGVNSVYNAFELDRQHWDDVFDVNVLGSLWCTQAVAAAMGRQGGTIVNISSLGALRGMAGQLHYAASKGAMLSMTRCLAAELGPRNIRVNAVCPTLVKSPLSVGLSAHFDQEATFGPLYALPGVSCLEVGDVTGCVLWLASDAAAKITGQTIVLDAGSWL